MTDHYGIDITCTHCHGYIRTIWKDGPNEELKPEDYICATCKAKGLKIKHKLEKTDEEVKKEQAQQLENDIYSIGQMIITLQKRLNVQKDRLNKLKSS